MTTNVEDNVYVRLIVTHFAFLSDYGFERNGSSTSNSDLMGLTIRVRWRNAKSDRDVDITFVPAKDATPPFLSVLISTSSGDKFGLEHWARFRQKTVLQEAFSIRSISDKDYIALVAEHFRASLDRDLEEVFSGRKWLDVPFYDGPLA